MQVLSTPRGRRVHLYDKALVCLHSKRMSWLRIILFSFANSPLDPPCFLWKPSILHNLHKCLLTARGDAPWLMNHLASVAVKSKKREMSFFFLFPENKENIEIVSRPKHSFFFFSVYLIILLYNVVLVLPYIDMNPPWVYTCSPSWTPLPPPSPSHP